jgi:hypothetical protein
VVSPFIPRKMPISKKALIRQKPRRAPVFGQASLMSLDEAQLVAALDKTKAEAPQVKVANDLDGLSKPVSDPLQSVEEKHTAAEAERHAEGKYCSCGSAAVEVNEKSEVIENDTGCVCGSTAAKIQVESDRYCVCGSVAGDSLVHCGCCFKAYHPVCIGKGLQGYAPYQDDHREQAMLDDANFYRKDGGFTCSSCDDKALADKEKWALNELRAEKSRRGKLFVIKYNLNQGETLPRECDHCQQEIISARFECQYCEDFDLCRACFADLEVTSMHQHAAGDMKLR